MGKSSRRLQNQCAIEIAVYYANCAEDHLNCNLYGQMPCKEFDLFMEMSEFWYEIHEKLNPV